MRQARHAPIHEAHRERLHESRPTRRLHPVLRCGAWERCASVRLLPGVLGRQLLFVERQHAIPVILQIRGAHEKMAFSSVTQVSCRFRQSLHLHPYLVRMLRSEEHTSELQSLMRISYAVFCLTKKKTKVNKNH